MMLFMMTKYDDDEESLQFRICIYKQASVFFVSYVNLIDPDNDDENCNNDDDEDSLQF